MKLERDLVPHYGAPCPLAAEPDDQQKVLLPKKKVTPDDYGWMIGTWRRDIPDPDGQLPYLLRETFTVHPGGTVDFVYDNPLGPTRAHCAGKLAYNTDGVLVTEFTSRAKDIFSIDCHDDFGDHPGTALLRDRQQPTNAPH